MSHLYEEAMFADAPALSVIKHYQIFKRKDADPQDFFYCIGTIVSKKEHDLERVFPIAEVSVDSADLSVAVKLDCEKEPRFYDSISDFERGMLELGFESYIFDSIPTLQIARKVRRMIMLQEEIRFEIRMS